MLKSSNNVLIVRVFSVNFITNINVGTDEYAVYLPITTLNSDDDSNTIAFISVIPSWLVLLMHD